jgi:FAD dependent oxidoreductase
MATHPSLSDRPFDVVVTGAGSAGATAAIAAARAGARTLLLERYGFLGGTSTAVLDTFYGFYTPGSASKKVVGGVADNVVFRLRQFGACLERPNTYGAGTGLTYNTEYLKVVWDGLVREAGASVLMHAWVQDAEVVDRNVTALIVATKRGLCRVEGRVFVDASGDADVCHYAGAAYEAAGRHEPAQSLTTTFKMANVDMALRSGLPKHEFHARMSAAAQSGGYDLPRREGSDHITPIPHMTATNMTRVQSFVTQTDGFRNATDPFLLSEAEFEGRRQALEYVRFLRAEIPGYAESDLVAFSVQIGVRETRRVIGDYQLTRDDVLSAAQFSDQIGLCGAPIEDHHHGDDTTWAYLPDGRCVGIPYRTLLVRDLHNVLVAGRCFSATHDAQASVRSMAQCMAMGQAAGAAAALATRDGTVPRAVNVTALQDSLRQNGALLSIG